MEDTMKKTICRIDSKGNIYNYGVGYADPYEVIPKHYKYNGMFYESNGSKTIYTVEQEDLNE